MKITYLILTSFTGILLSTGPSISGQLLINNNDVEQFTLIPMGQFYSKKEMERNIKRVPANTCSVVGFSEQHNEDVFHNIPVPAPSGHAAPGAPHNIPDTAYRGISIYCGVSGYYLIACTPAGTSEKVLKPPLHVTSTDTVVLNITANPSPEGEKHPTCTIVNASELMH